MQSNNASETLRNTFTVLFYKRKYIVWTMVICIAISMLLLLLSPRVYYGTFSVLVRASNLDTSRILPGTGVYVQPQAVNLELLTNEQSLVLSDAVLSEVNRRIEKEYPDFSFSALSYAPSVMGVAVNALQSIRSLLSTNEPNPNAGYEKNMALRKLISPEPIIGTHTIEVKVYFYDPDILSFIQKNLLAVYLETRGQLITTKDTLAIYEQDVAKFYDEWTSLEKEKAQYQVENNLYNTEKQRIETVDYLLQTNQELANISVQILEMQGQLQYVQQSKDILGMRLSATTDNRTLIELENQISLLMVERGKLLANFLPSSPPVMKIEFALNELTKRYTLNITKNLKSRIAAAITRREALQNEKNKIVSYLNELEKKSGTIKVLEAKTNLASQAFHTFSSKLQKVKLQNLLSSSSEQSLTLVREPFIDNKPMWPNTILLIPLSLVIGIFFGVSGAIVSYYFEDTILMPSDLRFTQLPVIDSFAERKLQRVADEKAFKNSSQAGGRSTNRAA